MTGIASLHRSIDKDLRAQAERMRAGRYSFWAERYSEVQAHEAAGHYPASVMTRQQRRRLERKGC